MAGNDYSDRPWLVGPNDPAQRGEEGYVEPARTQAQSDALGAVRCVEKDRVDPEEE